MPLHVGNLTANVGGLGFGEGHDSMDNDVDGKYAALPERLYALDAAGHIAYRSELGPWGFDVDAWTNAIADQVATA